MAETPTPSEVGFAEFAAKLITDVFDAVVTAQLAQEQRLAQIATAAEWPLDEFAEHAIADDATALELARLFPGDSPKHPTSIFERAPYQPAGDGIDEHPPVEDVLGLRLGRGDYATRSQSSQLTPRGVERIIGAVRSQLALEQYEALQELVRRGVPRVIADAGRVNSKLTYQVVQSDPDSGVVGVLRGISPAQPLPGGAAMLPLSPQLGMLRLLVRPADERAPQNQELRVNVFGEVEITFKTVT